MQSTHRTWTRLVFALVGVLGVTIALTAVLVALPQPAVGGTCGPGKASETPLAAFFDPGSIGAGVEPPTSNVTGQAEWLAFVSECQSATDARILTGLAVLVLSVGVALLGPALLLSASTDRRRQPAAATPASPWGAVPSAAPPPVAPPAGPPGAPAGWR
jgi:hypothetical protein